MTYNTDHLIALTTRLSNEKERHGHNPAMNTYIQGIEREIANEEKFLESKGVKTYASDDELTLDELFAELASLMIISIKFYPHTGRGDNLWREETAIINIDEISHVASSQTVNHGKYSTTGTVVTMKNGDKFCTPEKVQDLLKLFKEAE